MFSELYAGEEEGMKASPTFKSKHPELAVAGIAHSPSSPSSPLSFRPLIRLVLSPT